MRKFELMILILLFLLAACTPQAAAVTPTATPATEMPPVPTSTPEPTSTPTPEPSPTATETAEPTKTPIPDWESLTDEEKMQIAITAKMEIGMEDAVAFVYDQERKLIRTEDGRVIECSYDLNDIWNGENLERYVGDHANETEEVENANFSDDKLILEKAFVPIVWDRTEKASYYEELGLQTIHETPFTLQVKTVKAEIPFVIRDQKFGFLKEVRIEFPRRFISEIIDENGLIRSHRERTGVGYTIYSPFTDKTYDSDWSKMMIELKINSGTDKVMLLMIGLDHQTEDGINSFYRKVDGKEPLTEIEIKTRENSVVMHAEPIKDAFVVNDKEDFLFFKNNISEIEEMIILPAIVNIGAYR